MQKFLIAWAAMAGPPVATHLLTGSLLLSLYVGVVSILAIERD